MQRRSSIRSVTAALAGSSPVIHPLKRCPCCKISKENSAFHKDKSRKNGFAVYCKDCVRKKTDLKKSAQYQKKARRDPTRVGRFILEDARKADKRRGLENNLDRVFVDGLIANGCSYCGETELRMTLDRIDNTKGHTRDNVVSSCVRCNMTRGNMPYEAWEALIPAVRNVREAGLFEGWVPGRKPK